MLARGLSRREQLACWSESRAAACRVEREAARADRDAGHLTDLFLGLGGKLPRAALRDPWLSAEDEEQTAPLDHCNTLWVLLEFFFGLHRPALHRTHDDERLVDVVSA